MRDRFELLRPAGAMPALLWRAGPGVRMISSGVLGGGIGPRAWVLNAQVPIDYLGTDPAADLAELAGRIGLRGPGVGLLTAAEVPAWRRADDHGLRAAATVGVTVPTWAAAPYDAADVPIRGRAGYTPGTINIVVAVPAALSDAALVNLVLTVTEAKTQALLDAGCPGTGTASDAVCVASPACPAGAPVPADGRFGGPRSVWGARAARAVHRAVLAGARRTRS